MTAFVVRTAVEDDIPSIAEIHYAGWCRTYGDIVSAEQLAEKLPERRIPIWRDWMKDSMHLILVGEDASGKMQGFVFGGPVLSHEMVSGSIDGFDAELYVLHCRAEVQGRGLGKLLMAELARQFHDRGAKSLVLWAYRDNAYRGFYEKLGGELVAEGIDDGHPDVAYGWREIEVLIKEHGGGFYER